MTRVRADSHPDLSSSISSHNSSSVPSRSSTPLTEPSMQSSTLSLPPESEESRRRREQSDLAATELGNYLLKGWTMLAAECPNPQCYGVPLVRPRGGEIKECVICKRKYATTIDENGEETLVLANQAEQPGPSSTQITSQTVVPVPKTENSDSSISLAVHALETSLSALSSRLLSLTKDPALLDPSTLGQTADAISKTADALSRVQALR